MTTKKNNNNKSKIGMIAPYNANSGKAETEEIEKAEWESDNRRPQSQMEIKKRSKTKIQKFDRYQYL